VNSVFGLGLGDAPTWVSTTLDLYAHVMPTTRREAADTLAALLG